MAVLADTDFLMMGVYLFVFMFLFIVGLFERFAMVMAAIVSVFIALELWLLTSSPILSALFIFITALCIGLAITEKVGSNG